MTFDQQYYRINDARLQGKLLVSGQKWQDFAEDRKKLAPIERIPTPYLRLRYYFTLERPLRAVYWKRKKGKLINTVDALEHFKRLR